MALCGRSAELDIQTGTGWRPFQAYLTSILRHGCCRNWSKYAGIFIAAMSNSAHNLDFSWGERFGALTLNSD
jgi:hypothetical protein